MFGLPAVWGFIVVVIASLKERVPRIEPGFPARVKLTVKTVFDSMVNKCKTIKPAQKRDDAADRD